MADRTVQLLGETIGGFKINRAISSGRVSRIFEAISGNEKRALKIAREANDLGEKYWHSTSAIGRGIGICVEGPPQPEEFISLEFERLKLLQVQNSAIVDVGTLFRESELCFYDMEYVPSKPFRSLLSHPDAVRILIQSARTLHELRTLYELPNWGNLKPEHILVSNDGIKLISPGIFDQRFWVEGLRLPGAITSPAYYPTLEPIDLFAFGLMMWETFLGVHPLQNEPVKRAKLDMTWIGNSFLRKIEGYEGTANYFPSALL